MRREEKFIVRFRGVRGSYPVPGEKTVRVGGNTTCLEVQVGGNLIIFDAGTGIISLGHELVREHRETGQPILASLFFTHTHHDHTQGFPFFEPAYLESSILYVFGPKTFYEDIEGALQRAMLPPFFPVALADLKSLRIISNLDEGEAVVLNEGKDPQIYSVYRDKGPKGPESVTIKVMRSSAHPKGVSIYKVEWAGRSVVFATDTEGYIDGDTRLIYFSEGTDLLIHDAQFTEEEYISGPIPKQGWGHSTPQIAIQVAKKAEVKSLALFHHDPMHDDDFLTELERQAQAEFPQTMLAREGLILEL